MYNGQRILAVIPARSGSKGLPGKNIRELAQKPLIAWSIEAGRQSRYIDTLTVSTDSQEIARVASFWGGDVPFIRPAELAQDDSKGIDAIFHAIHWHRENGDQFDLILVLQPTSPLRTALDIDQAIELFFKKNANAIVSVCQTSHHPWWANTLPEDGNMKNFLRPELQNTNRQELPIFYQLNGAIYLADIPFLEKTRSFITDGTFASPMSPENSIDIDNMLDFRLASSLLVEREKIRPD
ncbi:MAG: acylneuraminate cytidylyltransferase family protein [Desulfuromonadales bacterium]|nr:acylneuraminate cytidylyltransferase family protein [Desulfuromonadales bacterium]MCK4691148.1 acylneuraminate cytidylyltransferase family protein [Desulfuromonadales bacterium]